VIDNFDEEIPKYRKASQAKPPKKAKHKHLSEPCVLEHPADWWQKEHLRTGEIKPTINYYCPICGKIMGFREKERWYTLEKVTNHPFSFCRDVETEECIKEFNPETRTLPTFHTDSPFDKFVSL
jgi:hypothetical protein